MVVMTPIHNLALPFLSHVISGVIPSLSFDDVIYGRPHSDGMTIDELWIELSYLTTLCSLKQNAVIYGADQLQKGVCNFIHFKDWHA
jgi:hypothetical protein